MASDSHPSHVMPMLLALTGGALVALALQIALSARGLHVSDVWTNAIAGNPLKLRAALVWWVIAGSALVTGAILARALIQFPPPWELFRTARWIAGAVIVFGLAHVGHEAALPEGTTPAVYLMASGSAVIVAAVMAMIGAVFALRA